ncbi:MAG: hypothetical protein AAF889_03020, partial [Cyanobacteria bacterium P01_D01_bin.73]
FRDVQNGISPPALGSRLKRPGQAEAIRHSLGLGFDCEGNEIYDAPQKSWDADLYVDSVPLAVKTQTQAMANRFGLSWTFQAGSQRGRRDPILDIPEAWVCFVKYDEAAQTCWVYAPRQIATLRFGEPKLAKLRGFKKVVYADRLLSNF